MSEFTAILEGIKSEFAIPLHKHQKQEVHFLDALMFGIAAAIFAVAIFAAMKRPGRMGIGYPAAAGALICLATGITTIGDAVVVVEIVWNATLTLVAIIISSIVFDEAGFFEYIAARIAFLGGGNGFVFFTLILIFGAAVSVFFSNDGAVLVMTPVVYSLLVRVGVEKKDTLPFLMGLCIIADTASNMFVVSNLTNIITAGYFHIGFIEFFRSLALPDIVSISATVLLLLVYYRKKIPAYGKFSEVPRAVELKDTFIVKIAGPFIVCLMILYSVGSAFRLPVGAIAIPAAIILLLVARLRKRVSLSGAIRTAPWQIVLFSLGIYIIVFGLSNQGLSELLTTTIGYILEMPGIFSVILSGTFFALLAAMFNNLPSIMMVNLALAHTSNGNSLIYANVIGNNIGPGLTPFGSLSTLLWLNTLERKGALKITVRQYMKTGTAIGIPVLLATLFAVTVL